jgi:hypothetical protein
MYKVKNVSNVNLKVRRDVSKLRIGNKILHEISNGNGVIVIIFTMLKM